MNEIIIGMISVFGLIAAGFWKVYRHIDSRLDLIEVKLNVCKKEDEINEIKKTIYTGHKCIMGSTLKNMQKSISKINEKQNGCFWGQLPKQHSIDIYADIKFVRTGMIKIMNKLGIK